MRRCVAPLVVLCASMAVYGQAGPPMRCTIEGVAPGGTPTLVAKNQSDRTVTAFIVEYETPTSADSRTRLRRTKIYDAATEPLAATAIDGDQEIAVKVPIPAHGNVADLNVVAVLFKDGSSWGDGAWVERVVRRRRYMEKHIRAVMAAMGQAVREETLRALVIERLSDSEVLKAPAGKDPDEIACARSVLVPVLANLINVHPRGEIGPAADREVFNHALTALGNRLTAIIKYGGQGQ
jgi:hypothetical protein